MAVTTAVGIYNLALSAARAHGNLTATTDNNKEAEECNLWYDNVRQVVQEASQWPSSKATAVLALNSTRANMAAAWTAADPAPPYKYVYDLPADYLRAWYLTDYSEFSIELFDGTPALHSNTEDAVLVYAVDQADVSLWTPSQQRATAYGLAGMVIPALTGKMSMIQLNFQLANAILIDARTASANVGTYSMEYIPSHLLDNGYDLPSPSRRYLYPAGQIFPHGVQTVG